METVEMAICVSVEGRFVTGYGDGVGAASLIAIAVLACDPKEELDP
jgi:hypothetical protein